MPSLTSTDERDSNRQLLIENVDLSGHAIDEGRTIDGFFYSGVASGIIYADALNHPRMVAHVVNFIAENRPAATPGASTPDEALKRCLFIDPEVRARRARASGIMRGWRLGTEHRADAVECRNCDTRICTDIEDHESCQEHGVFCDDECRADWCGRACHEAEAEL